MAPKYSSILCFFIGIIFIACSDDSGQIDDNNGNLPDTQNIALGSLAPYNQSSYLGLWASKLQKQTIIYIM